MNANHQRHLLGTFRHLDNLLSAAEHTLAGAGPASPFAEHTQDSTPVQRKVVHDYVQRVRAALARALADLGLPRSAPVCGALWAARGHVTFATIAVAEMEARRMRGYGPLSAADTQTIDRVVAELNAALDRLAAYLDQGPAADLQARLERLEQTRDELPLLRALERVITRHGLVEFRGALTRLLDRLEDGAFEIGVFGRVSSGKSSLLNQLLGGAVLPVGVTPVTAVPTRIRFGAAPRAIIEFAASPAVEVDLSRLAEFSTEQQNPGNAKHVARVAVEVPAPRLREGVTFVDTPGLGSLATRGAEETVACLPRCDLGLVLVDGAATLTPEDLAVVQALYQAGARAMVLVSKADLLPPGGRQQALAYTRQRLATHLGVQALVQLVSVVGGEATLCDQWFESELKPLLETHREQAAASLRRKIGGLREAVVRTLAARRQGAGAGGASASRARPADAVAGLRQAEALLEAAEHDAGDLMERVPFLGPALIETAAAALAGAWQQHRTSSGESAVECAAALGRALGEHSASVVARLASLRRQLETTLTDARQALGAAISAGEPLPRPAGLPVFDPAAVTAKLDVRPPRFLVRPGMSRLRHSAWAQLQRQLGGSLPDALAEYLRRLRPWLRQTLTELRFAFHAQAGPLRAQLEARETALGGEAAAADLAADLQALQQWPQ